MFASVIPNRTFARRRTKLIRLLSDAPKAPGAISRPPNIARGRVECARLRCEADNLYPLVSVRSRLSRSLAQIMNWPRKCYLGARVIVGADDKLLTFARAPDFCYRSLRFASETTRVLLVSEQRFGCATSGASERASGATSTMAFYLLSLHSLVCSLLLGSVSFRRAS